MYKNSVSLRTPTVPAGELHCYQGNRIQFPGAVLLVICFPSHSTCIPSPNFSASLGEGSWIISPATGNNSTLPRPAAPKTLTLINYPYSSVCSYATEKCLHSALRTNQRDITLNLHYTTRNSVSSNSVSSDATTTTSPTMKGPWWVYCKRSSSAQSILVHLLHDNLMARGPTVALQTLIAARDIFQNKRGPSVAP
jgi:hypothetical protein